MNPAPPLRTITDIERLLEAHAASHALLVYVESLGLPDAWIGAGFIRNSVWDVLHGRSIDVMRLADVDVLFFDSDDTSKEREAGIERRLRVLAPGIPWSVKNQARMHLRNGDVPYRSTLDAVAHWAETATAIAARSIRGEVGVMAPYGVDDLLNMIVRPTPVFEHKIDVYRERVMAKDWPAQWPRLTMLMSWEAAYPALHSSFDRIDT
ncbi:nucleotidyltransferase family protein [Microvirga terrestris]|uniref:Nucleotidyltransferase family protein n=1 Tax=Microvirga terrestris TaxID=2791024 RepID=A0ABS0HVW3_9HYPH|nr:nucleotidyltransferase family protein [Microvirga terrestris]MBF9197651.1 nucleotidyltransferase family protein [Microvirga terrestris]